MTMTAPRARIARSIASLVALALVSACNPGQAPDPAEGSPAAGLSEASPADGSEPTDPTDPTPTGSPAPVIASDEATFDFGTITPDGSVVHVFKLVNRGTADLHIERVERT